MVEGLVNGMYSLDTFPSQITLEDSGHTHYTIHIARDKYTIELNVGGMVRDITVQCIISYTLWI